MVMIQHQKTIKCMKF